MASHAAERRAKGVMAWVVDSNILLDIALDDPAFRLGSMELLRSRRNR